MNLELDAKTIVITGGTDGLGFALAQRLVAEGASVAICSRSLERVARAAEELAGAGGSVLAEVCDVSDASHLERFAASVLERFGQVDGLVNNAGHAAAQQIDHVSDEQWQADLDLKLFAAIRTTRLFTPALAVSGGAILNVLAISGKHPGASSSPTAISRAAGLAFTKAASKDLGPRGIRVNAILIGFVASGQWRRAAELQGLSADELEHQLVSAMGIPLGRMGRAEEFADLGAFLLSPLAGYLSGVGINLDGGLSSVV